MVKEVSSAPCHILFAFLVRRFTIFQKKNTETINSWFSNQPAMYPVSRWLPLNVFVWMLSSIPRQHFLGATIVSDVIIGVSNINVTTISAQNQQSNRRRLSFFGTTEATTVSISSTSRPEVVIYIHDKIKGYMNWQQPWFVRAARDQCPNTQCVMTESPSALATANLVLFHAPTHNVGTMPQRRKGTGKKEQIFALLSLEQPRYAKMLQDKQGLENHFQLLATYSLAPYYPGSIVG